MSDTNFVKIQLTLQSSKPPKGYLYKNERKLPEELNSDTLIVILTTDKISAVVILNCAMDHIHYGLCQLLKKDPSTKTTAKIIKALRI